MIVCVCHRISDRDIAHAVRQGCASFDDLQIDHGVATTCGKCRDCARRTFELHASAVAAAASGTAVCFASSEPASAGASLTTARPELAHSLATASA